MTEPAGSLIDAVIRRREPELAERLRSSVDITDEDRWAVETALATELSGEMHGPDWEPTDHGRAVERALEQFFLRYPNA